MPHYIRIEKTEWKGIELNVSAGIEHSKSKHALNLLYWSCNQKSLKPSGLNLLCFRLLQGK